MKNIVFLSSLFFSNIATSEIYYQFWYTAGNVSTITVEDNYVFIEVASTPADNPSQCQGYYLVKDHPNFPEAFSMLSNALIAKNRVTIWGAHDCTVAEVNKFRGIFSKMKINAK